MGPGVEFQPRLLLWTLTWGNTKYGKHKKKTEPIDFLRVFEKEHCWAGCALHLAGFKKTESSFYLTETRLNRKNKKLKWPICQSITPFRKERTQPPGCHFLFSIFMENRTQINMFEITIVYNYNYNYRRRRRRRNPMVLYRGEISRLEWRAPSWIDTMTRGGLTRGEIATN